MENLVIEIERYFQNSHYKKGTISIYRSRLNEFTNYLAKVTDTVVENLHLEKVYAVVNKTGKVLFYESIDSNLIDQYFFENIQSSYNWLASSKRALHSFFLYLNRKYDFEIVTEGIKFSLEIHKEKPLIKGIKYVPTRHNLLRFLQSLLKKSDHVERDSLFFILLISTGSRVSEILNTKINEIDFKNETIYRKDTKNGSSKFIVLRDGFGDIIQKYTTKHHLSHCDFLFNKEGKKMSASEFQEIFKFLLIDAKLPPITLHKLRHAFATVMAESGADIIVIQQLLGHKKIQSTKTYIDPNYIRNMGMVLEENKEVYKHIRRNR